ncbi:MAG: hypothetical protein HY849_07670 [Nitrosomonadales bacterium]|nr:hypothetical protein [Nitrosomonadales bacterium]
MRRRLRRLFLSIANWCATPVDENFDDGFDGIPSSEETNAMTARAVARRLANINDRTSAGYLILSHELNLKIAKEQSKATLTSGWVTAIATVIVGVAGFLIGTSSKTEVTFNPIPQPATTCNCTQNVTTPLPAENKKQATDNRSAHAKP